MAKSFKFPKVMKEFKEGKLHSGSKDGPVVSNPQQAKAIAVSESKKAGQYAEGGEINIPKFELGDVDPSKGVEWASGTKGEGLLNRYHKNGMIKTQSNWKDQQLHGPWKGWHENGKLEEHGYFHHNKEHGQYKKFDENGKLVDEKYFHEGKETRPPKDIEFDENSIVIPKTGKEKYDTHFPHRGLADEPSVESVKMPQDFIKQFNEDEIVDKLNKEEHGNEEDNKIRLAEGGDVDVPKSLEAAKSLMKSTTHKETKLDLSKPDSELTPNPDVEKLSPLNLFYRKVHKMAKGGEMEFSKEDPRMWEIFQTVGNKRVPLSDEQVKKMRTEGIDLDSLFNQVSKNSEGGEIFVPESHVLYNKIKPHLLTSVPGSEETVPESKILRAKIKMPVKKIENTPEAANKLMAKEREFLGGIPRDNSEE